MSWLEAQQHWLGHEAKDIVRVNGLCSIDAHNNGLDVVYLALHLILFGMDAAGKLSRIDNFLRLHFYPPSVGGVFFSLSLGICVCVKEKARERVTHLVVAMPNGSKYKHTVRRRSVIGEGGYTKMGCNTHTR